MGVVTCEASCWEPEGQWKRQAGNQTRASKTVLLIDDDEAVRNMISAYLKDRGFDVVIAVSSFGMAEVIRRHSFDMVLLDIDMSDGDGMVLLRDLRAESDVPVILLADRRRDEIDRVVGLEIGGDDFLTKPFGLRELQARIGAVLRRYEAGTMRLNAKLRKAEATPLLRFVGWKLKPQQRRLISPSAETVRLTKGEFSLLLAFLQAPRRVLSREQLIAWSRAHNPEVFDRSIDVQILRLRRKLEVCPAQPKLIVTERGAGYVFTADVSSG